MKMNDCEACGFDWRKRGALYLDAISARVVFIQLGTQQGGHILLKIGKIGRYFEHKQVEAVIFPRHRNYSRSNDRDVLIFYVERDPHWRDFENLGLIGGANRRHDDQH
jgi:hypothetical protein